MDNNLQYFLINDLPKEFGDREIIAGFRDKEMAYLNYKLLRGYMSSDSYTYQYLIVRHKRHLHKMGLQHSIK